MIKWRPHFPLTPTTSIHANISKKHSSKLHDFVAMNFFTASISKWTPSWCHLWMTAINNHFQEKHSSGFAAEELTSEWVH